MAASRGMSWQFRRGVSKKPKEKLPPLPFKRWVREVARRSVFGIVMALFAL